MNRKYLKKPIEIEAIQWTGDNWEEICNWVNTYLDNACSPIGLITESPTKEDIGKIEIITLEGRIFADKGDYIIKGIKGEFYPCKPDIFEATYEEVFPEYDGVYATT